VRQRGQRGHDIREITAHLNPKRTLTRSGQHGLWLKGTADALSKSKTYETGRSENNGIKPTIVEFAQTGIEVAPQWFNPQIWPQGTQQRHAAQAGCANHRA
jgi:hypothetical protein